MTPAQREAAARLADELQRFDGAERESLRDEAAALLRELLAEPVINHKMTTEPAEPQGEPVAWRSKERINGEFDSGWKLTSNEPPQTPRTIAIEPLYTHPPQQRQPLTEVQITELAEQCGYDGAVPTVRLAFQGFKLDDFAHAVERFHGIVEAP